MLNSKELFGWNLVHETGFMQLVSVWPAIVKVQDFIIKSLHQNIEEEIQTKLYTTVEVVLDETDYC